MKLLIALGALALSAGTAMANPIALRDTGTFQMLAKDRSPLDMYYRLSREQGAWKMEGKDAGSGWKNIGCGPACTYTDISPAEAQAFFPESMSGKYAIACIKNAAQAFCRYTMATQANQGGYVVVALVTGRPQPIFLRRVAGPAQAHSAGAPVDFPLR